ncbi:MAG: hypothetical protein ICV72_11445 [Aldersonia sp.]|nr:hypothetical protein [Aldersonia sp.]
MKPVKGNATKPLKTTALRSIRRDLEQWGDEMHGRSLMLVAPRRLVWTTDDVPSLGSGELLIETRTGAVSIGTELPLYRG